MSLVIARINAAVDSAVATATHAGLHTGAPGAAGTANTAAGVSRASISWGAVSGGVKTGTATWTIPGAGGPFSNFSLWDAASAGTFYGDGTLSPAETFAGAGTLGLTVTVTGS